MKKLRIKSLEMEGFRSFVNKTTVEFPAGATLIKGPVSGSGKSSIVVAAAHAVGFSAPPATELRSWYAKKMSTKLVLTDDEQDIVIKREPKLSVRVGEVEKTGKDAEAFLDELLGVDRELAETLTYREQRKPGAFLYKTDSDRKDFLSRLIPSLREIEVAHDSFNQDLATITQRSEILAAEVQSLRGFVEANVNANQNLLGAQASYSSAYSDWESAQNTSDKESELRQIESTVSDKLRQAMQVQQKAQILKHENEGLRSQLMTLKGDIEALQKSICPTCRREWMESMVMLDDKQVKLKNLLERFQSNTVFQKNAEPVIEAIPAFDSELRGARNQMAQLSAPKQALKSALDIASAHRHECIRHAKSFEENSKKLGDKVALIQSLEIEAVIARKMVDIFGRNGFMGVIFDEVLGEIESRANDMMGMIPNVNRFTLALSSVSVAKNGNTKRSISVRLHCDAAEIGVGSLSGGQKVVTELCIDLAIAETIRRRSGCRLGWIVLDEAMDGLDVNTKQCVLDMVISKVNGQVIVIDHATEVQEGFSKIVDVNFDGRVSSIA